MDGSARFVRGNIIKKTIGVSSWTLRQWADTGKINSIVSPGGQRLYEMPNVDKEPKKRTSVAYARVSSSKQRGDLRRQIETLRDAFPDHEIVVDVASGINWKRKGLRSLLERCRDGDIEEIAVAARDRLCRFSFELLEYVFGLLGARIVVLDSEDVSPEQELSDDLLSIVQIFCCRKNGKRRYVVGRQKNDATNGDPESEKDKTSSESGTETADR
jgi:predicted site-specific integrase-resolvase